MNDHQQMLSDLIIGAVEGGTGYWAEVSAYKWSDNDLWPASAVLHEMDGDKVLLLDVVNVENAMYRIAYDAQLSVRSNIRSEVLRGARHERRGQLRLRHERRDRAGGRVRGVGVRMKVLLTIETVIDVPAISDVNDNSIIDGLWQWIAEGEGLDVQEMSSNVVPTH